MPGTYGTCSLERLSAPLAFCPLPPSNFLTIRRHFYLHGSFDVEDSKHVCSNMYDPCSLMSKRFSKNLLCEQHQVCYGVSFLVESKLVRYLAKSQHTQVKLLYFVRRRSAQLKKMWPHFRKQSISKIEIIKKY